MKGTRLTKLDTTLIALCVARRGAHRCCDAIDAVATSRMLIGIRNNHRLVTFTATDVEFDAYWEEEARNPHRNRIRIGRQYQASIQPLLKKGTSTVVAITLLSNQSPRPIARRE